MNFWLLTVVGILQTTLGGYLIHAYVRNRHYLALSAATMTLSTGAVSLLVAAALGADLVVVYVR